MVRGVIALILLIASPASMAFTYVPMTDAALAGQAPVVVLGKIAQVGNSAVLNRPVTEYELQIVEVLKGLVPTSSIFVQTPGVPRPAANARWLPGTPAFDQGDALLLFLQPLSNGNYGIVHMGLGAFELVRDAAGELVFQRNLENTRRLPVGPPRANAINEAPRQAKAFLERFGVDAHSVGLNSLVAGNEYQTANFTTLGTPPSRWFEFDEGQDVAIRSHVDGQPGMTNDGVPAIQAAIAAWTNDANSNIRYVYGGTTTSEAGFRSNDGINAILFDDPNGEVEGSFTCQEGGVLAAGGFVSSGSTSNYNGAQFAAILEVDIITNDGAGCYFGFQGDMSFGEEIFGHELGHTLGFGHSCGETAILVVEDCDLAGPAARNALMRAFPHGDGRGATLTADDRNGAAFLYEQDASTTPPPDDGDGEVVMDDEPDVDTPDGASGGGGSGDAGDTRRSSGGGGGGCSLQPGAPVDPLLWLLSLTSLAWLLRRKATACKNH